MHMHITFCLLNGTFTLEQPRHICEGFLAQYLEQLERPLSAELSSSLAAVVVREETDDIV